MATENDNPGPNTSVPHDETVAAEVGGRIDPEASVSKEQPDPTTSVPHDET